LQASFQEYLLASKHSADKNASIIFLYVLAFCLRDEGVQECDIQKDAFGVLPKLPKGGFRQFWQYLD
jgi:hypothetical protein